MQSLHTTGGWILIIPFMYLTPTPLLYNTSSNASKTWVLNMDSTPCSQASTLRNTNIEDVQAWRAWHLFSHDHDVIEIGPKFLEQL